MHDHITTVLDLLGSLLIVAGIAAAVALVCFPAALAVGGAGLLAVSWLTDRRARTPQRRGEQS